MMENRTFYYGRVSSKDQNLARQYEAFHALGATDEQIITDKASGKDTDRPGYQALKSALGLRRGDTLVIKSIDRLSRKKADIKTELQYWKDRGVRVKILDIPTTLTDFPEGQEWVADMVNNILIEVLGSMAEQEREERAIRQREGLDAMNKNGRWDEMGRPNATYPPAWDAVIAEWRSGSITAVRAMQKLNVKKTTFYKLLKQETK